MVTVGFCTKEHNEEFIEYLKGYFNDEVEIIEKICNQENGLTISAALNQIIEDSKNETIILLHDNVRFIWTDRYPMRVDKSIEYLFEHNKEYGIIGIASACKNDKEIIDRDYSCNCSLYAESESNGDNLYIFASEDGTLEPFTLGLCEDVAIDGCFIALRRDRLKSYFCEENTTFHFYDIELCISNYNKGVKIGKTKAFLIQHYKSQNEILTWNNWNAVKNNYFLKKWQNTIPIRHYKNEVPLLIITAVIDIKNVVKNAESIYENLIQKGVPNLMWFISVDNKIKGSDISEIINVCEKYHINNYIEFHGSDTEKNYGGTMFNEMLYYAKNYYYGNSLDPWVYILDNDNIICPLMGSQIKDMTDAAKKTGKKVIWMSMHREDGFIDTIRSYSIYGKGVNNNQTYADEFMPDPSQLLMRLSLIDEMGYFDEGFAYDQRLWRFFYEHLDMLCLPEEWHEGHWQERGSNNFYQCYHNGINDRERIDEVYSLVKQDEPICYSLVVGLNEKCERFILDKNVGNGIMKKMAKPYKYSILTCIFNKYETLKPIVDYRDDVEYVCVTDDKSLVSDQWKIVYCKDFVTRLPLTNQFAYVRFHPFQYVSTDICVTVDASVEILKDLWDDLIQPFVRGNYKYGGLLHYSRSDIYDEINAWKDIRGYKEGCYDKVVGFLKDEGYNMQGMVDGGLIVHTDTKEAHAINDMAWELCHELTVDTEVDRNFQIDLAYILNKYYTQKDVMLIHPFIMESSYIRRWTHNSNYWIVYNSLKTCPCLFWDKKIEPLLLK